MTPSAFAAKTNEYITSYITFADAKAGALLTFVSLLGGAVGFAAPKVLAGARTGHEAAFAIGAIASVAFGGGTLGALWCGLAALIPRAKAATTSLHSFPDLAELKPADLAAKVLTLGDDDVARELSAHNVTLSRVARDKFGHLSWAIHCLRVALLAAFVLVFIYGIIAMREGK